jgi:hypothetical protein
VSLRSALLCAVLAAAPAVADSAHGVLPFIQDDYAKALAQARSRSVPIFIEAWAPW